MRYDSSLSGSMAGSSNAGFLQVLVDGHLGQGCSDGKTSGQGRCAWRNGKKALSDEKKRRGLGTRRCQGKGS